MPTTLFAKRIKEAAGLFSSDLQLLRSLRVVERALEHHEQISHEGEMASRCTIVLSGFLARYKIVGTREQIISIHVPGDFADLQTLHLPAFDHNVMSIGAARVAQISHAELRRILDSSPRLARAFWRETLIEAAMFRQWVCNVAARDALSSIAHLICELTVRLDAVGLVDNGAFHLPLVQQDVANACGLSVVHVNRTVNVLRDLGLIEWEARRLRLRDFDELKRVADFDDAYLHLSPEPRP